MPYSYASIITVALGAATLAMAILLVRRGRNKNKNKNKMAAVLTFPEELPAESLRVIQATAAVVAPRALDITSTFYKSMFTKMPELFAFFNRANQGSDHKGMQPQVLAAAIVAYASNISDLSPLLVPGGAVDLMAHKHCALNVLPEHYPIVHDNLMAAVGKVLGEAVTPEIAKGWSDAVLFLAGVLVDKEESLYAAAEARSGGWRGLRNFRVTKIEHVAKDVKRFTFSPKDGRTEGFDFTPGQYLSISIDPDRDGRTCPRHYTITSAPGSPFLQCTIKRVPGGKVSGYMHSSVSVGDTIKLCPPFGCFTPPPRAHTAVLISAGIGATPMVSFARHFKSDVALLVHIDKAGNSIIDSPDFADVFNGIDSKMLLSSKGSVQGHSHSAKALVKEIVCKVGKQHAFYVCGPASFMQEVKAALGHLGASKVFSEAFGPWTAGSGCPMRRF